MSPDAQPPMPTFSSPDLDPGGAFPQQSQSWSAAAISGFVLSLVGCLIITGVLGLIFGIVGILKTSGGRRRGRGLAIAAIPISIVMAGLGIAATVVTYSLASRFQERIEAVAVLLRTSPDETTLVDAVQHHFSPEFREAVTDVELRAWLDTVREKHGSLVGKLLKQPPMRQGGTAGLKIDGKFVNGTAPIVIRFAENASLALLIDDLEVDGKSPRGSP